MIQPLTKIDTIFWANTQTPQKADKLHRVRYDAGGCVRPEFTRYRATNQAVGPLFSCFFSTKKNSKTVSRLGRKRPESSASDG